MPAAPVRDRRVGTFHCHHPGGPSDHQHPGRRRARRRLGGHGQQRPQPARHGRARRPADGSSTRSPHSASSATSRPATCGPGAAGPSGWSSSTSPTRSSPTWPAGSRRSPTLEGLAVILCNSDDRPAKEAAHLDVLAEQRGAGRAHHPDRRALPALDALRERGVPVVLVDRRAAGPDQCSVAVDDVLGGRLAADHLLERGHRRIAFVGGSSGLPQVQERHDGVELAVREACGSDDALTVLSPATLTVAGGREAAEQIIGLPGRPPAHRRDLRQRPAGPRDAAGDGPPRRPRAGGLRDRRLRRHRLRRGGRRPAVVGAQAPARAGPAGGASC